MSQQFPKSTCYVINFFSIITLAAFNFKFKIKLRKSDLIEVHVQQIICLLMLKQYRPPHGWTLLKFKTTSFEGFFPVHTVVEFTLQTKKQPTLFCEFFLYHYILSFSHSVSYSLFAKTRSLSARQISSLFKSIKESGTRTLQFLIFYTWKLVPYSFFKLVSHPRQIRNREQDRELFPIPYWRKLVYYSPVKLDPYLSVKVIHYSCWIRNM